MPSGAAVIRYAGKRGVVWRIKYADATGRQVMETLGPERDGWTEQRAERELGKRLERADRDRYRKPRKLTFAVFAARFLANYLPGRNLKPSTLIDYEGTVGLPATSARHGTSPRSLGRWSWQLSSPRTSTPTSRQRRALCRRRRSHQP
jgi:hypothetical protein